MDLDDIPQELLIARGLYATIRSEHEESKKRLQALCGQLSAVSSQVLRAMQPDNNDVPDIFAVLELIETGRSTLRHMEACASDINKLAKQRYTIKLKAWPRK